MSDNLKVALNIMQDYLVSEIESDNVLYIADMVDKVEE